MYTIQENVRIVIATLKAYNIRHVVISPGGTNIPVSQAMQDDPFFQCYSVPDERSAMYFAIGLHLQTGEIVATSCTSAQATRNYIPGLTEAFYKHVPILAITTSKLERFQYQDYMQAPDQTSLPKDAVKRSFDLPPVRDNNTRIQCQHAAIEAILELTHHGSGPVQLNIRIDDTENGKFEDMELPAIKPIKRYTAWDKWDDIELGNRKVLIVMGECRDFTKEQQDAIELFCESHNATVYANNLSNYHGKYSIQANLLVSCTTGSYFKAKLSPEILITIGGQTGDYSIFGKLNNNPYMEHWRISEDGNVVNTYNCLTKIFECPPSYFFRKLKKDKPAEHIYFQEWNTANTLLKENVEIPFSNLYAAQQLYQLLPKNSYVNFAILNSLRCWGYFKLDPSIKCFSNVAAFGIDGGTSTLIGESMNTGNMCFMITGDLAFFYDMNSLGIRHIKKNLRILLINNNGGAEFRIMTGNWKERIETGHYISAEGHNGNAKGWAENCGFTYLSAKTKEEFQNNKDLFIGESDKPVLFEIFTQPKDEKEANESFISSNKIDNMEGSLKSIVKNALGEQTVRRIKQIINK